MNSVMLSIKPKYCELIASGKKTIEVRKSKPKLKTPFKCYIYCTKEYYRKGNGYFQGKYCGKVIGEFVCDEINVRTLANLIVKEDLERILEGSCLSKNDIYKYLNIVKGKSVYEQPYITFYLWHISKLVIYDKPKELSEFKRINRECWYADLGLAKRDCPECHNRECFFTRPPQSWCYVEVW